MARADVLLDLVRAAARGEQALFRKALEALVAEERAKQHHILADRLAGYMSQSDSGKPQVSPVSRNGSSYELYYELRPNRRFSDLILETSVYQTCQDLLEEQNRADILRSHNLEPRHRVLLAGDPGNGKTSLAEAFSCELGVPLLVVRYEAVIASYLGETAVRLSRLFEQVRTMRCVLFFDEFDVVGKERGDVHETGEIKRVVSSLLLQIDALPSYVVVVTATNHPELLDRAVWRRFQLRLELRPPKQDQVEEWFLRLEKELGEKLGVSLPVLARRLKGLSFSELEQFSLDLRRRHVLSLPNGNLTSLVSGLMDQWNQRFTVEPPDQEIENARTSSSHTPRTR